MSIKSTKEKYLLQRSTVKLHDSDEGVAHELEVTTINLQDVMEIEIQARTKKIECAMEIKLVLIYRAISSHPKGAWRQFWRKKGCLI